MVSVIPVKCIAALPRYETTSYDSFGSFSDTLNTFLVFFGIVFFVGCFLYLTHRDIRRSASFSDREKSAVDKRIFQLRRKSEKIAKSCDKEDIKDLFMKLSTTTLKFINLLNKRTNSDSREVRTFLSGKIDLYLEFLNQYKEVMGCLDDEKLGTVQEGITNMIAEIENVCKDIINDRYLKIDINNDVIKQLSK